MSKPLQTGSGGAFGALRRFVRRPNQGEHCAMCGLGLRPAHQHIIEFANRKLICVCDACAILFDNPSGTKYRRVPRRVRFLTDFRITDSQWDGLMLPINMAFFFRCSQQGRMVAMYPSPAGGMESLLTLDAWEEIARENPALRDMESDVEALLVNRLGYSRGFGGAEYYIVPVDECYKLIGLIRTHWRGLSGGTEVWRQMAAFFAELKTKAGAAVESSHA
jgi:hypothetical protein